MVEQKDIDALMQQLRSVLLGKPITPGMRTLAPELAEMQEALEYLAECLRESNDFLRSLCAGNLNMEAPGRHNFVASNLKELHSILKHLSWQTTQVAAGDYSQKVRFLGEFSDSFNLMVQQLKEREIGLSAKTKSLAQSMSLLRLVLDGQRDWVVVTDTEERDVIYTNLSAKRKFYNPDTGVVVSPDYEELLDLLTGMDGTDTGELEYACKARGLLFLVRSFPIEWNERQAVVHCITDVTDEREEMEQLHNMAYTDMLTGAHNRRYCLERMASLMEKDIAFSIVLIDLDGLKTVNDQHGHVSGDDYIISVAQTIAALSRTDDRLCRIGGDEFVLLLPECTEHNAEKKMRRVCNQLAALDKTYALSISYGVIFADEDCTCSPEELFSLADVRMYAMKQQRGGRGEAE